MLVRITTLIMKFLFCFVFAVIAGSNLATDDEPLLEEPPLPGHLNGETSTRSPLRRILLPTPPGPGVVIVHHTPPGPGSERRRGPATVRPITRPTPPGPGDPKEKTPTPPNIGTPKPSTPEPEEPKIRPPEKCNETTRLYMDYDTAVAGLLTAGVTVSFAHDFCTGRSVDLCTSLTGLRHEAVEGIVKFAQTSKCKVIVTEGTEVGHDDARCSHGNGWRLSIKKSTCIDIYIRRNLEKKSRQHYLDDDGNLYIKYDNKWNIIFKPKYECPCDPTPLVRTTYPQAEAREIFDNNYVVTTNEFNELSPCTDKKISYCTHYGGLRTEAVFGITKFNNQSECRVEIIGGTETTEYHAGCTYKNGLQLSIRSSLCIYRYIVSNLVKRSRQHYTDADGNLYIQFQDSWDIQFKSPDKNHCSLDSLDASVFSHNEAREIFDHEYIVTTNRSADLSPCISKIYYCTSYDGLRRDAVMDIIKLKSKTGCTIAIVDGTETQDVDKTETVKENAGCWHTNGLELAVKRNPCWDDYITNRLPKLRRNGATDDINQYIMRSKSWGIRFQSGNPPICPPLFTGIQQRKQQQQQQQIR